MLKAQAIADISYELASVTSAERASSIIRRALQQAGLSRATTLSEADVQNLLTAIAIEGGAIQEIAEQVAIQGLELPGMDAAMNDRPSAA